MLTVNGDALQTLITTYGAPLVFLAWMWWNSRGATMKQDPTKELIETLQDLRDRMVRVETKLEIMGK